MFRAKSLKLVQMIASCLNLTLFMKRLADEVMIKTERYIY